MSYKLLDKRKEYLSVVIDVLAELVLKNKLPKDGITIRWIVDNIPIVDLPDGSKIRVVPNHIEDLFLPVPESAKYTNKSRIELNKWCVERFNSHKIKIEIDKSRRQNKIFLTKIPPPQPDKERKIVKIEYKAKEQTIEKTPEELMTELLNEMRVNNSATNDVIAALNDIKQVLQTTYELFAKIDARAKGGT